MSILATLTGRETRRQAERKASIADRRARFIAAVANDEEPAEPLDKFLDECGMTLAEVQANVDRIQERRRLVALLSDEPRARKSIADAEARLEKARGYWKAAQKTWDEAQLSAQQDINQAGIDLAAIGRAKNRLRELVPPEAVAKLNAAQARVTSLANRLTEYQRLAGDSVESIKAARAEAERAHKNMVAAGNQQLAQAYGQQMKDHDQRRAAVLAEIERIEPELTEAKAALAKAEAAIYSERTE